MNLLVLQSYSHSVSHGCDLLYIFAYNSRIPVLEYSSAHNILLNTAYKINFWNMFYSHNFYFKRRIHIEGLHSFSCLSVLLTVYLFVWLYLFYFFPFLNFSISVFICFTFSLFSITSLLWTGCPCFTRIFMKVIYMNFLSCTWTKPTLSICTVLYNFSLALNIWFKQFWMSRREASLEFRSGEFVKIEFVSRADYLKTF